MISFIIIGRNEGWKLKKCFESIQEVIKQYKINKCEIIYVDSDSNDGSMEFVSQIQNVQVLKLYGNYNAAIARNEGAKISKGSILFFLDGDMEFIPANFKYLFNDKMDKLIYSFISGDFLNCYYKDNLSDNMIYSSPHHNIRRMSLEVTTGGLFVIERRLWIKIGGMRNEFRRSQDLDLGLRLAKIGTPLKRLPHLIVLHHTVEYTDKKRFWNDLRNGNFLYRGLLIRKNITNKNIIKTFLLRDISLYSLIIAVILSTFTGNLSFMLLFFGVTSLKVLRRNKLSNFFLNVLQSIIIDLNTLFGFLFFYPKLKDYKVERIK